MRRDLAEALIALGSPEAAAVYAQIESRGNDAGVDAAIGRARALIAPRGPQWVCENCHHVHAGWHALCANCGGFDTLAWTNLASECGA